MDIPDGGNREALLDCCFNLVWARSFPAEDPSIITKGLQREREISQLLRKLAMLGKYVTRICVNENRPG